MCLHRTCLITHSYPVLNSNMNRNGFKSKVREVGEIPLVCTSLMADKRHCEEYAYLQMNPPYVNPLNPDINTDVFLTVFHVFLNGIN